MSFINVALRGRFRWEYDGLYQNDDGTLSGQNESVIIMAPDGFTNASSSCSPAPYFDNALQCASSDGPWVRIGLNDYSGYLRYEPLLISNEYNYSTSVSWIAQELTVSNGYMMALQVNHTYQFSSNNVQVS
jgi:hypothetical protein